MNSHPLRVLILEDSLPDAELMVERLRQAGYDPEWHSVSTEADFLDHLNPALDIILADFTLPQWDAAGALRTLRTREIDIPFIIVSGTIGEELAVECMKQGAADYLLKDRLARLGQSVMKALDEKRLRAEKQQADAELKRLKEFNENIVQTMVEGIALQDAEGVLTFLNPAVTIILGYTPEELIGRPSLTIIPPNQHAIVHAAVERRKRGEIVRYEVDVIHKDGTLRTLWISTTPRIEGGRLVETTIAFTDITERKRAEQARRESEDRYRFLFENMLNGFAYCKMEYDQDRPRDFIYLEVNGAFEAQTGLKNVVGKRISEIAPGIQESDPGLLETYGRVALTGIPERFELYVEALGMWFSIAVYSPQREYFIALFDVITERKQAQIAEREQRVWAEALADTATALNSTLNLDDVFDRIVNNTGKVVPHDAAYIMLIDAGMTSVVKCWGFETYGAAEAMRALRVPVSDLADLQWMADHARAHVVPVIHAYPAWVHSQATAWADSYVGAPLFREGRVIGFLGLMSSKPGFFTEIDARRLQAFADQASLAIEHAQLYEEIRHYTGELEQRVEERTAQLNRARDRMEAILNSADDIMILCRTDGIIEQVNPAFDTICQSEPDDVVLQPFTRLFAAQQVPVVEETFRTVVDTRRPARLEATVTCDHHQSFDADMVLSPIVQHDDRLSGVVCSLRDITRRKQMEAQLQQMLEHEMKLVDLKSRYVSMAAHDLRNPLAVIKSATDTLQRYSSKLTDEQVQARYDHVKSSIKVMLNLLDDILTIGQVESGKITFNPTPMDVTVFCQDIVSELGQIASPTRQVVFSYEGECGVALLDAKLLRHILSNLLSNALKYSPDGKPVTFSVSCAPDQFTFQVQDQGIGIPAADQARLFEAFYRASNARQLPGTGLGLAIVKQSVELHGGSITFESTPGNGTTFTVVLPKMPIER